MSILTGLLIYIAGCIYMMRGGSTKFPIISKLIGKRNPETRQYKVPRWMTVTMQLFVITPFVLLYHLPLIILPLYVAGWYATIASGWGDYFQVRNVKEALKFFWRILDSLALFVPLAVATSFTWESIAVGANYSFVFAAGTVLIYKLYNYLPAKYRTDYSYNWSEFLTGALLAGMTFILMAV